MAYKILGKNGLPIKRDDSFLHGSDLSTVKIMDLDEKEMTFLAVGSTEDEDRDKDIIRVEGWDIKNFKKNPVIPWGHNYYNPPIGKAVMVKVDKEKKQLVFKPKFDDNDEEAVKIFNKYKNGYLTSFSVGFLPQEYKYRDEDDRWGGGVEFVKTELLEISAVTIPANPKANVHMRSIDENAPVNMLQMGYMDFYTKSDTGLYFPLRDTSQFISPNEIEVAKGIIAITGKSIVTEDSEKITPVVAYKFDADIWSEKEAGAWIKENGPAGKQKVYFNIISEKKTECDEVETFEIDAVGFDEVEIFKYSKEEDTNEEEIKDTNEVEDEEIVFEEEELEHKEVEEEATKTQDILCAIKSLSDDFSEIKTLIEKISKSFDKHENSIDKSDNIDNTLEVDAEGVSENDNLIEFDSSLAPNKEADNEQNFIEIDSAESMKQLLEDVKKESSSKVNMEEQLKKAIKETFNSLLGKID